MNLTTNDPSGLFLLPLSSMASQSVWDIFNGLGIVFLPFIVMFVVSFLEARAQGLDEGSPAVLAIKNVEKGFWPMLLAIMMVVMPTGTVLNMKYAQYSCMDNPSLTSSDLLQTNSIDTQTLQALGIASTSPSMVAGIVHTLSTGINSALTSGLACTKGASKKEVSTFVRDQIPSSEAVYRSVLTFNNQCFALASAEAQEAMAQGKNFRSNTNNLNGWSFRKPDFDPQATLMHSVYNGTHIVGESRGKLTMEIPNTWFTPSLAGQTKSCATMSEALYNKLKSDVLAQANYQEKSANMLAYVKMFNSSATQSQVLHDLTLAVYNNALTTPEGSKRWFGEATEGSTSWFGYSIPSLMGGSIGIAANYLNDGVDWVKSLFMDEESTESTTTMTQALTNAMVTVGALWNNLIESGKAHAVTLIGPILVVLSQTILMIALPILMILSGYSGKFLFNWVLLYFSVSVVPFWLNLSTHLETILLSLSDYSESLITHADNISNRTDMQMYLISATSATFVYLIPVVWVMLVQMVGNIAASSFMTMIAGAAVVGQQGGEIAGNMGSKIADETSRTFRGKSNDGAGESWDMPPTNYAPGIGHDK